MPQDIVRLFKIMVKRVQVVVINLEAVFNDEASRHIIDYAFTLEEGDLIDSSPISPVRAEGEIVNRAGLVTLEAELEFQFSTLCARCVKEVKSEIKLPVSHLLVTSLNEEDYDDYFILLEDYQLDLDELFRENILLNFPSRTICSDDCKGLCMNCGADLSKGKCECKKSIDPRLSALAELLSDED